MVDLFIRYVDGSSKLLTKVDSYEEVGKTLEIRKGNATTKIHSDTINDVRVYD